jgi:hypothetical protein
MRCKVCKDKFEAKYFLQKVCLEPSCILEWSNKVKDKEWKVEKKQLKDKLKTYSDHVKELQVIVNKYVRLRDKDKGCISCDAPLLGKYDAGHYYSAGGNPELRFNTDNIHGQCVYCNQHRHGSLLDYTERLPNRIGLCKFAELKKLRGKPMKYSIPELILKKNYYKELIKSIK